MTALQSLPAACGDDNCIDKAYSANHECVYLSLASTTVSIAGKHLVNINQRQFILFLRGNLLYTYSVKRNYERCENCIFASIQFP